MKKKATPAPKPLPTKATKPKIQIAAKTRKTIKTAKGRIVAYKANFQIRPDFYHEIAATLTNARSKAYRAIDSLMVEAYWDVGRQIAEEEQLGNERADYGTYLLRNLAMRLIDDCGPGYDERELRRMRQFYRCFPIRGTVCPELSWSHYRLLIRVEDEVARHWYMKEAAGQNWSVRALARQINTLYYQRLLSSKDQRPVIEEMLEKTAALAPFPRDFIRDPVVLEFLDIPTGSAGLRESRLEQAIINKLQHFLLELGKGFAFVARQQRISTDTKNFFIDLVFYNYILKCFVLIDLKMDELTHADIGQMDMYVRLYEDQHKGKGDNPTVGLILCTEKDQTVVKYSMLNDSKQIFAAKYQLYLPSEEELRRELERERAMVLREDEAVYGMTGGTKTE